VPVVRCIRTRLHRTRLHETRPQKADDPRFPFARSQLHRFYSVANPSIHTIVKVHVSPTQTYTLTLCNNGRLLIHESPLLTTRAFPASLYKWPFALKLVDENPCSLLLRACNFYDLCQLDALVTLCRKEEPPAAYLGLYMSWQWRKIVQQSRKMLPMTRPYKTRGRLSASRSQSLTSALLSHLLEHAKKDASAHHLKKQELGMNGGNGSSNWLLKKDGTSPG
jgi:hypothetical protein